MRRDGVTESDIRALLGRLGNARTSISDCTVSEDDTSTGADPALLSGSRPARYVLPKSTRN
jgi:hypothetical protein